MSPVKWNVEPFAYMSGRCCWQPTRQCCKESELFYRQHLRTFSVMKAQCCADVEAEEQAVLSAMAAEALFPGGVMEMRRAQGLTSLWGLYTFARDSEADAVRTYSDFAEKCTDPQVRAAFESIAKEEGTHLTALEDTLATLAEN